MAGLSHHWLYSYISPLPYPRLCQNGAIVLLASIEGAGKPLPLALCDLMPAFWVKEVHVEPSQYVVACPNV